MAHSVLTAIINYQTPDLLATAVESFRGVYPDALLELVDNGSKDGSSELVRRLAAGHPRTRARLLEQNIFHGPAMDLVLRESTEDLVFFLDSDTVTRKPGFLEEMGRRAAASNVLAVGHVVPVDRRGFAAGSGTPVPASAYMMVNRSAYQMLPPFIHHGLPVLKTCLEAERQGLRIESFPVEAYIDHLGRGTAAKYGYGLGLKSRISYLLHRLGM